MYGSVGYMEERRRDRASLADMSPLCLDSSRLCCDLRYSSTKLLLSRSGAAWGRNGARPGGSKHGAASRGAKDLLPPSKELTALIDADAGGQEELRTSSVLAALKPGGDAPCDLVTFVKALPGVGSSRGGEGCTPGDPNTEGGDTLRPPTRLTLAAGEGTSDSRVSWAPVRKATSKVRLVEEV